MYVCYKLLLLFLTVEFSNGIDYLHIVLYFSVCSVIRTTRQIIIKVSSFLSCEVSIEG